VVADAGRCPTRAARDLYSKLLAAGVTSLILCQATLNFFAVMGMAPLTGVPLPFLSYGSTNLIVLLAAMGVLLNVAATRGRARSGAARPRLEAIEGGRGARDREERGARAIDGGRGAQGRDRGRRDGRARGARAGGR
jgi:cell division protein FtsW